MGRAHRPFCLANLFTEVPLVHSCQAAPPSLTLRLEHPRTPSPLKSIISLALSRLLQPLIRPPLLFICFTTGLLSGRDLVILGPVFLDRVVSSSTSSPAVFSVPPSVSTPLCPVPLLATRPRLPERAHFPDPDPDQQPRHPPVAIHRRRVSNQQRYRLVGTRGGSSRGNWPSTASHRRHTGWAAQRAARRAFNSKR